MLENSELIVTPSLRLWHEGRSQGCLLIMSDFCKGVALRKVFTAAPCWGQGGAPVLFPVYPFKFLVAEDRRFCLELKILFKKCRCRKWKWVLF